MKLKYRIRLATEHDLEAIFRIDEAALETDRFTREQLDYLLTESSATSLVLETGNAVVGSACLLWRKSHRGARLYNIVLEPSYQGIHLGARLLRECELEAARRDRRTMVLEVREDNPGAVRFFEKHGFAIQRMMAGYYDDGMAGVKMSKTLKLQVPCALKRDVPYYAQTLDFTCGPACLMMALKYFNPRSELTRALELTIWKEATLIFMASGFGGTDGYGLALSALNRGLICRMVMSMDSTPLLKSVRTSKKRDVMKVIHNDLKRKARRAGLGSAIYDYGMDEIIAALHRDMLPIVMISTYRLTGDRVPHWVVVTGCDKDNIYIHDPDVASYKRNRSRARHLRVEKSEFLRMTRYGKEVYRCLLTVGRGKLPLRRRSPASTG